MKYEIRYNPHSRRYRIANNKTGMWVHWEWELCDEWRGGVFETRFKWRARWALKRIVGFEDAERLDRKGHWVGTL